jgi:Lecithin retinol acyltransferase
MNLQNLISENNLKQADAIVLRKKILGMVDHYAIFLGYRGSYPVFVANYKNGVKEVSIEDMREILQTLQPTSIERFNGTEPQRQLALNRAMSRIGETAYNYIANNCEHFKNWVHTGEHRSEQVKTAGKISIGIATGTAIYSIVNKSPKAGAIAVGLLLLGALLKNVAEDQK